jgi:hypothetical protein
VARTCAIPADRFASALIPLRLVLDAAVAVRPLDQYPAVAVVLPRRRGGRARDVKERRFLTRDELARLLDEVPACVRRIGPGGNPRLRCYPTAR